MERALAVIPLVIGIVIIRYNEQIVEFISEGRKYWFNSEMNLTFGRVVLYIMGILYCVFSILTLFGVI